MSMADFMLLVNCFIASFIFILLLVDGLVVYCISSIMCWNFFQFICLPDIDRDETSIMNELWSDNDSLKFLPLRTKRCVTVQY